MPWYRRRFEDKPQREAAVFKRFETIFFASDAPEGMLFVKERHGSGASTLWLRLPDAKFRSAFKDFEDRNGAELPRRAIFMIGHKAQFESLFEYDL